MFSHLLSRLSSKDWNLAVTPSTRSGRPPSSPASPSRRTVTSMQTRMSGKPERRPDFDQASTGNQKYEKKYNGICFVDLFLLLLASILKHKYWFDLCSIFMHFCTYFLMSQSYKTFLSSLTIRREISLSLLNLALEEYKKIFWYVTNLLA